MHAIPTRLLRFLVVVTSAFAWSACTAGPSVPRNDDTSQAQPTAPDRVTVPVISTAPVTIDAALPVDATTPDAQKPRRVTLAAVGDILFARYLSTRRMRRIHKSERNPFDDVATILRAADIAFGNVESPVMPEPRRFSIHRTLTFRADPSDMHTLADAGFDVVSLANNHAYDMGTRGPLESRRHVEAAGMLAIGTGRDAAAARAPAIIEKNGVTVALIAYTVWLKRRDRRNPHSAIAVVHNNRLTETVGEHVREIRRQFAPDVIVVSLHWGIEYEPHPEARQRASGRAIIDAGADIILGHHPHVIQDIEHYAGGVIVYSLGNFLFDNRETRQRRTMIFQATLEHNGDDTRVVETTLYPVIADRTTLTPRRARARAYRAWTKKLRQLAPDATIAPAPDDAFTRDRQAN